ncbi:MAG: PilZ domain-containing protein [Acidobacteriaceae bacterium]|nr:PilZ domain-containing protein [Acidobacteriaceae bacterium]MBV8569582.1 PilZ domain-containing protein [Acidobacteriaceae bacterium]
MEPTKDRRSHTRLLCAELIELAWRDASGRDLHCIANLEDISVAGLCLQLDKPVFPSTRVKMVHGTTRLEGIVRHCRYDHGSYFIGVQWDEAYEWSTRVFRPRHLLDPRDLEPAFQPL